MKTILCVLSVLIAAISVYGMPPEMKKVFEECSAEVGLPNEKPQGPPDMDDPKIKCLHACMMKKKGKMVDGKVVPEKEIEFFMKHNPDESVKEKITECATKANEQTDECEVADAMRKCIREKVGPPRHHHHPKN